MFEVKTSDGLTVSINPFYVVSFQQTDVNSCAIHLSNGDVILAEINYEELINLMNTPRMRPTRGRF